MNLLTFSNLKQSSVKKKIAKLNLYSLFINKHHYKTTCIFNKQPNYLKINKIESFYSNHKLNYSLSNESNYDSQKKSEDYAYLGFLKSEQGKFDEAEKNLKKAIDLNPKNINALTELGYVLHKQNKITESQDIFKKVLELNPNEPVAHINIANYNIKDNKLDEAILHYEKMTEINPSNKIFNNLAFLYSRIGKKDEAAKNYRKAIQLDPNISDSYYNLAIILNDKENYEEAEIIYVKGMELSSLNPNKSKTEMSNEYAFLEILNYNLGKLDNAEKNNRKALELDQTNIKALVNLGILLSHQKKLIEALELFKKASEIDQNDSVIIHQIGLLLLEQNKLEEALIEFKKELSMKPDDYMCYNNIGFILEKLEKTVEA